LEISYSESCKSLSFANGFTSLLYLTSVFYNAQPHHYAQYGLLEAYPVYPVPLYTDSN